MSSYACVNGDIAVPGLHMNLCIDCQICDISTPAASFMTLEHVCVVRMQVAHTLRGTGI